jgi:NitT/TauT family transport system substrate-binding protein
MKSKVLSAGIITFFALISVSMAVRDLAAQVKDEIVKLHVVEYSPTSIPYLIAREKGYYRDVGLDVQGTLSPPGPGVQALLGGSFDASLATGIPLRAAVSKGAPVKVVMVFTEKPLFFFFTRNEITSVRELRGKTLASSSPGGSSDTLLRRTLELDGINPKQDLTIVYIGLQSTLWLALRNGSVDGAMLVPPYNVLAREGGFREHEEFTGRVSVLQGGVSLSDKFVKERPDVARRFLQATTRGLRSYKSDRSDSIATLAKYMGVPTDTAAKIYEGSVTLFTDSGFVSETYQRQVIQYSLGKFDPGMPAKGFDFSIVRSFK